MQALSELLQGRLDSFHRKFGKDAELDKNRIWAVTNVNKPEDERVKHTINGTVISDFVFRGDHDIEFVGYYKPKDNSALLNDRRSKAVAESKAAIKKLQETEVYADAETGPDNDEVLANPSEKKVKQKE